MDTIEFVRRKYAEELARLIGLEPEGRLVDAFASVPRERFLGPGPWPILGRDGYHSTPDDDPRHLYRDVLVGLVTERRLNNGKPSFLAHLMHAASITEGEHVVHLGCGVGYYSAVMAELVGPGGRVTAIEADPELATRAIENLDDRPNVEARHGDAATQDFEAADVVLVNFGMTHPPLGWLERLKPNGRLLLPITAATTAGAVLRFHFRGDAVAVRAVAPTVIFSSISARDPALEPTLQERFSAGPSSVYGVASLRLDAHIEDETCWLHGEASCLSTRSLDVRPPLRDYAGTFHAGAGGDVVFTVRGSVLHAASAAGTGGLIATGDDCFEAPGVARMRFARGAQGEVTSVRIELGTQVFDARRSA